MTFDERLATICANMAEQKLDLLVVIHDGAHFIETPNPVFVLSGFKSLGPAAAVLRRDGETSLIVTPAWDAERAGECCPSASPPTTWSLLRRLGSMRTNAASPAWHLRLGRSPAA